MALAETLEDVCHNFRWDFQCFAKLLEISSPDFVRLSVQRDGKVRFLRNDCFGTDKIVGWRQSKSSVLGFEQREVLQMRVTVAEQKIQQHPLKEQLYIQAGNAR